MAAQKVAPVIEDEADWELIDSDSTSLDIYSDALFLDVGAHSGETIKPESLGLSEFADFGKFVTRRSQNETFFHLPSRQSWEEEISLSMLTPAKISSNKYLKRIIRFHGVPSMLRKQTWLLLTLTQKRSDKLSKQTIDDLHQHKVEMAFGKSGMPKSIPRPPTFGAGKISIAEHALKDSIDTLQAMYRILTLLKEAIDIAQPVLPQMPDVVAFLLHYQPEPEAFYTAYSMADNIPKYFAAPSAEQFDYLIRNFIPKLWSHMTSLKMTSNSFAVSWLTRLFVDAVPFPTALRLFDVYMHQGSEVYLKFGLALLKNAKDQLVQCKSPAMFLSKLSDVTKGLSTPAKLFDKAWKYKIASTITGFNKQRNRVGSVPQKPIVSSSVAAPPPSDSPKRNLALSSSKLRNFFPTINFKSRIMTDLYWDFIYNWMPMRYTIRDPILLHSMDQEGTSLSLIYKTLGTHEPSLVVVKSKQEKCSLLKHYGQIGTRECFVWSLHPEPRCWHWKPGNDDMFLNVQKDSFSMGAGGDGFGLTINSDWCGASNRCGTFQNDPLNGPGESDSFECVAVEIYAFQ